MKTESIYLLSESPISCYPTLAEGLGVDKALIVQQVRFWMETNSKDSTKRKTHFHNDRWWTYNNLEQWEDAFPWMRLRTIARHFSELSKAGILLQGFFHKDPRNRTAWYSIDFNQLDAVVGEAVAKNRADLEEVRKNRAARETEKREKRKNTGPCQVGKMDHANEAGCNTSSLQGLIYTETTNRDYSTETNSKVSLVKRFGENARHEISFDQNASHEANGENESVGLNPSGTNQNLNQSTGGNKDSGQDHGGGFSLKKEKYSDGGIKAKSLRSSFDSDGWYQMPTATKHKLARAIATRRMQYLIAFGMLEELDDGPSPVWDETGKKIISQGNQILVDSKDFENEPEDEAFHPSSGFMSLKQLRSYAVTMAGMDQDWFNWTLERLFDDSVQWCKQHGSSAKKLLDQKSMFLIFGLQDFSDFELKIAGYEGGYYESRIA